MNMKNRVIVVIYRDRGHKFFTQCLPHGSSQYIFNNDNNNSNNSILLNRNNFLVK